MAAATSHNLPSHIAVVEDDAAMAMLLSYNIEAAGFSVDWIANGSAAIARIDRVRPDLVVLDWMLPGLSGIEILRRLRSAPSTRQLPVLMLTGRSHAEDRQRALATGATAFLAKPFSVGELMTWIARLIRAGRDSGAPMIAS